MEARRVKHKIIYKNIDISKYLIDLTYTDNTGLTDDVTMSFYLENDIFGDFLTCDIIEVYVSLVNWNKEGDNRSYTIGSFEIDSISYSDVLSITAVSVPITSSIRNERKNKAWENVTLETILKDIAKVNELKPIYLCDEIVLERAEQEEISDLLFLDYLAKENSAIIKISDGKLILIDETKVDAEKPICTIDKINSQIIGTPTFTINTRNIYRSCEIKYFDETKKKLVEGSFTDNKIKTGYTLHVKEEYNETTKVVNLTTKAKSLLREQNKKERQCSLSVLGDFKYYAGTNVNIEGYNKFDGKYHIETATHSIGSSGYVTELQLRLCLDY